MNKFIKYCIVLTGIALCSCDALDLAPTDEYSINNYWKTEDQCSRFITGLHIRLRSRAQNLIRMGELRGGTLKDGYYTSIGQTAGDIAIVSNSLSYASPGITGWGGLYNDILQINHGIESITAKCGFLSEDKRNYFLGQLYGLRAFYYFHLLRTYGGVPLEERAEALGDFSSINSLNKARSTERETMQLVRDDIERSVTAFEADKFTKPKGTIYWTKTATHLLRAEICLWSAKVKPIGESKVFSENPAEDLATALESLEAIENAAAPMDDFDHIFREEYKDNNEIIFAIRYLFGEAQNFYNEYIYPAASFTGFEDADGNPLDDPYQTAGGVMKYEYKMSIYDGWDDGDQRKHKTLFYFQKPTAGIRGTFLVKFIGTMHGDVRSYNDDIPVYRYMDVILDLAEVHNALGNKDAVKKYIEIVRKRAYGKGFPEFTYTTYEEAEQAILYERKLEFIAEGKYWYDVRRMNGGAEAMKLVYNAEKKLLWPIDSGVLSTDPLVLQTPGY